MHTSLDEPLEFLGIVASKGYWNDNTVQARRTACNKFFDLLDESEKNVEYVRDNLDVIKRRYMNLNREVSGATVDEYGRRVKLVTDEFTEWKADRAAWERKHGVKQASRSPNDGKKRSKAERSKARASTGTNGTNGTTDTNGTNGTEHTESKPTTRTVTFPLRPDFDLKMELPPDLLTVPELKRLLYFLLPYAQDWEPTQSPRSVFDMLERE